MTTKHQGAAVPPPCPRFFTRYPEFFLVRRQISRLSLEQLDELVASISPGLQIDLAISRASEAQAKARTARAMWWAALEKEK